MAIDDQGNIYVAEFERGQIEVFDAIGQFLTRWGDQGSGEGQLLSGDAVALDRAGGVYVADSAANRIVKFRLLPPLAPT